MKKYLLLLLVCVGFIFVSSIFIDDSDILLYRLSGAIISVLFVFVSWGIIAYCLLKSEPNVKNENMSNRYKEVTIEEINKYGIDASKLKKIIYQKFIEINIALNDMNKDYLKKHLTDDLYKAYVIELNDLKKENKRIINKDYELIDIKIYNIKEKYGLLYIDIYLNVRMIDCIVNISDNMCNCDRMDFEFELNFVRKKGMEISDNDCLLSKKTCINKMEIKDVTDNM